MPRKKSTNTLKNICLSMIARNMNYWCDDYKEHFAGQNILYFISSFDCLPQELLQNLIDELKANKLLKKYHLRLILQPELGNLSLSQCSYLDLTDTVNLIGNICKNLRRLDFSCCAKIPNSAFAKLPSFLPQIQVLNLSRTPCFDTVLSSLGGHCHELRELNVNYCPRITDAGISGLCVKIDDSNSEPFQSKLESLSVFHTKVTVTGAICALNCLPRLKCFNYESTCLALKDLNEKLTRQLAPNWPKTFNLQSLNQDFDGLPLTTAVECLAISTHLCAGITHLSLDNTNLTNSDLMMITSFKNLHNLSISTNYMNTLSCVEGLIPVLQVTGSTLKSLSLAYFSDVVIGEIGFCCPDLQELEILFPKGFFSAQKRPIRSTVKPFFHLEDLRIISCEVHGGSSTTELLQVLMNSFNLKKLFLSHCQELTDSLVNEVLNSNSLPKLECIKFYVCNSISVAPIQKLLTLDSPLKQLILYSCREISKRDHETLLHFVEDGNLNLSINWE